MLSPAEFLSKREQVRGITERRNENRYRIVRRHGEAELAMNLASILLIVLSGDGYWFGGRTETVEVQWAVKQPIAAATITWRLVCGGAQLASGRIVLPAKDRAGKIELTLPEVRVPTEMRFIYRAEQAGQQSPIAEGTVPVHVYPKDILVGVAQRVKGKQLFVWDRPDGLPALLTGVNVPFTLIRSDTELQFVRPDMMIVGPDQLGKKGEGQAKLMNLAMAGTSMLVLRQTQPDRLTGYPLVRRVLPPKLAWQSDHPLARHLPLCVTPSTGHEAVAIQLPADEPALEIAWWRRETPGTEPVPIDALAVVKARGKGRLVLNQIPLGPWQRDPRSHLVLADALD
jgi:hypothetical protein